MSESFAERVETARLRAGISYERLRDGVLPYLMPQQVVSQSTLRRNLTGDEKDCDPVLLWAVAKVLDVPLSELSPLAADWFQRFLHLVRTHDGR